jgi:hypothetical protein
MARALLVAHRHAARFEGIEAFLDVLNRTLTPDNIVPRPPAVATADGVLTAIFNPSGATYLEGTSAALGAMIPARPDWHRPGAPVPDGSFALLRANAQHIELVADAAGSRTLWYVLTADKLIASSSQRAIIAVLGNLQLNRDVLPWILSSGTLGPNGGWDARLQQLRPGERLLLDRARWRVSRKLSPVRFEPDESLDEKAHTERLAAVLDSIWCRWSFDPEKWVLPLSGGVDSRGLLCSLSDRPIRTVTWGRAASRHEAGNDAQIAKALADHLGVPNRFFPTDFVAEPREHIVRRFLTAGEGRVTKMSGYLDGFLIWKTLYDEGIDGVIRGDEAFGSMYVHDAYGARFTAALTLLSDYFPAAEIERFELPAQTLPPQLERQRNETLCMWRDRLYQEYRMPQFLAGLTDLKSPYVEVANPLLTSAVLECVRRFPDHLRTGKRLWRNMVAARSPDIPFADSAAVVALTDLTRDPAMLELMLAELESDGARDLFGVALLDRVCGHLKTALREGNVATTKRPPQLLVSGLRRRLRTISRRWVPLKPHLPPFVFAFRSFVASRMYKLLKLDAASFGSGMQRAVNL